MICLMHQTFNAPASSVYGVVVFHWYKIECIWDRGLLRVEWKWNSVRAFFWMLQVPSLEFRKKVGQDWHECFLINDFVTIGESFKLCRVSWALYNVPLDIFLKRISFFCKFWHNDFNTFLAVKSFLSHSTRLNFSLKTQTQLISSAALQYSKETINWGWNLSRKCLYSNPK